MKKHTPQSSIGTALKFARQAQGLTQEAFDVESSRVYISAIERGLKVPTISTIDRLSEVLGIHPLTLLTLSYFKDPGKASSSEITQLLQVVAAEINSLRSKNTPE